MNRDLLPKMIPAPTPTSKWFCAVTAANRQVSATLELYEMGFRTFLPKVRRWISHAKQKKAADRPLLGRYLFVEAEPDIVGGVCAARSVDSLLTYTTDSGRPVPVAFPSDVVEDWRMRYMAGEWDEVARGPLPIGAMIRIVEGEFANQLATVTNRKGHRIDFKLFDSTRYGRLQQCSVRAA